MDSSELADAQTGVSWLDNLSWLLVILSVVFLVAAVFFAEKRRSGVRRLGMAIVASMVLALLAYAWARSQYMTTLSDDVHTPKPRRRSLTS